MIVYTLSVACVAVLLSAMATKIMTRVRIGDVPNERSSHTMITPTSGGVGILAALSAIGLCWPLLETNEQALLLQPEIMMMGMACIGLMAIMGLIDDILILRTSVKFAIILILGAIAIQFIGPVTLLPMGSTTWTVPLVMAILGSLMWVFVVTNAANFIDGINGILISVMGVATFALSLVSFWVQAYGAGILSLVICAGLIGFAPFNFRNKAMIFCGDVGSLAVGFSYAIAVLWMCQSANTSGLVYIGPILIMPILADTLLTMYLRARRGENLLSAHRSHMYQRLTQYGLSHVRVALIYTALSMACAVWCGVALHAGYIQTIFALLVPALSLLGLYMIMNKKIN